MGFPSFAHSRSRLARRPDFPREVFDSPVGGWVLPHPEGDRRGIPEPGGNSLPLGSSGRTWPCSPPSSTPLPPRR